ncbi:MAG: hypothetical protein IT160_09385 [Bryobacterales bacterium]|nr:hypothetical protein [Bryobacterales bacterium]
MALLPIGSLCLLAALAAPAAPLLPGAYYRAMEAGVARVEARLKAEPAATLRSIEEQPGWHHFPHALLAVAVLYARPESGRYHDKTLLELGRRMGDLFASADERGQYYWRLDSYWDTYMWLEAFRLLKPELSGGRQARWRLAIERNVGMIAARSAEWRDFPAYTSCYIGTSTNHFALWAVNLMLAGRLFGNREWQALGEHILHRLVTTEQSPDGFWGEYSRVGPTSGYNLLTLAAAGVYQQHSGDPAALAALARATDFHANYTWPDGQPVEVLNDRNRHWDLSLYGNFAFTHTARGRRLALFFWQRFPPGRLDMEALGRVAQNALYYHSGPEAPIPQDLPAYHRHLEGPAGIRKSGPWVAALSGLIVTRPVANQWVLDRQSSFALFRQDAGLVVSGGNSKAQPELATFTETINGATYFLPLDSHLAMTAGADRLWVAFNSFFAELEIPRPIDSVFRLVCRTNGRGPAPERAAFGLQLQLHAGEAVETGGGVRVVLGKDPVELNAREIGGMLRHHGWTLETPADASLRWPVFPYNPYRNSPETKLEQAVGVLHVPLKLKPEKDRFVRPNEQVMEFRFR